MSNKSDYTTAGKALQRTQANSPAEVIKRQKAFLDARLGQLAKWVRGGVRAEALARFCLMEMQQNQKLREADPTSIYLGLLACAVTGLEPGALKGEAYLVPFSGRAQFMMGYRGYIKLAKRSGEVVGLVGNVVRDRDTFDLDLGTDNRIVHKPQWSGDRGDVIGAYAIATMINGHREIEFMDRDSLNRIRAIADKRGKSPAWSEWPDEQSRKSAIRRLGKRLPLGNDYIVARAIEERVEETGQATDVLDLETDGAATQAEQQVAEAPRADDFDPTDVQPEDRQ